jgi:P4 family phage/plasmid primase-like protien
MSAYLNVPHMEHLKESGISGKTARKAKLRSDKKGIVFPYDEKYSVIRLDKKKDSGQRYVTPPGKPLRFYTPPGLKEGRLAGTGRLIVTEGCKKTLKALQEGLLCVGLNGVWGWKLKKNDHTSRPIPDFDRINWKRPVLIVFDSDVADNPDVANAERALAAELASRGATVSAVRLPEEIRDGKPMKTGLDDYLCARGVAAFEALPRIPLREPGQIEVSEEREATDIADADELAQRFKDKIRFCEKGAEKKKGDGQGCWYLFDGKRWVPTGWAQLIPLVEEIANQRLAQAQTEVSKEKKKRLADSGRKLLNDGKIKAVLSVARGNRRLQIQPEEFDRDNFILNVDNGTLDLRTGTLRKHRAEDLITKLAPVEYDPDARSVMWETTIKKATEGDADLARFLQRVAGYTLTGDVRETKFFTFYGPTAQNGKSTILGALSAVLGDYACTLRPEALEAGDVDRIPHEIAETRGTRLVQVNEGTQAHHYNEGLLKHLTGGDPVSAAFKYGHAFTFIPSFKLFFLTNQRLAWTQDEAVWIRAVDIPFRHSFATDPDLDRDYRDKVRQDPKEQSAVLAWAVKGCLEWQQNTKKYPTDSLRVPDQCKQATEEHRKEVDPVRDFLRDACKREKDKTLFPTTRQMYAAYKDWAQDNGARQRELLSESALVQGLLRAGYKLAKTRDRHDNLRDRWQNLTIRE